MSSENEKFRTFRCVDAYSVVAGSPGLVHSTQQNALYYIKSYFIMFINW